MNDSVFNDPAYEELIAASLDARKRLASQVSKNLAGKQLKLQDVDDREYARRLQSSLNKDKFIVDEVQAERVSRSLEDWKRRVGSTFAGAETDHPTILERVNRLASNQGVHKTSILLHGNMGVGKSWQAYAYINHAISAGVVTAGQVVADTETGVLGKITVSGYKKPEMLEELLADRHRIFFIDDVGQGFFSDAQKRTEVWFELIDHIYTHQLTLIITTNLNGNSLPNWIGPRAFDRLRSLVGDDGYIEPSKVNKREQVLERNEEMFRQSRGINK